MKRLLLIMLALLLLLSGCAAARPEPMPEPVPEPEPEPVPEPVSEPTLLDTAEPLDSRGIVSAVDCPVLEQLRFPTLTAVGGDLLLSSAVPNGETGDLRLILLDGRTGQPSASRLLRGFGGASVAAGRNGVQLCTDTRLCRLDRSLRAVLDRDLSGFGFCSPGLNGRFACTVPQEGGLALADPETGSVRVLFDGYADIRFLGFDRDFVCFTYVDPDTLMTRSAALDLRSGAVLNAPFEDDFISLHYAEGRFLAVPAFNSDYRLLGTDEDPFVFSLRDCSMELLAPDGDILLSKYDGTGMALYAPDGAFRSSCILPDDGKTCALPQYSEAAGGLWFLRTAATGEATLCFWDLSVDCGGDALPMTRLSSIRPEEETVGTAVSEALYARAAALGETYGVTVRIAELCKTDYSDYSAESVLNPEQITEALDTLEDVFSSFPDGFFRQLTFDRIRGIEIELTGKLTPLSLPEGELNGYTTFAAFTQPTDGKYLMVLDITERNLDMTLCHELSHIIDSRLFWASQHRPDLLYSEETWASLNPEGFTYVGSYYELPEEIYEDGYDAWFTDTYARTFATEDRARIFESAATGWPGVFRGADGRLSKLRYYCECIRDGFDTTGWPEVTVWEKTLLLAQK